MLSTNTLFSFVTSMHIRKTHLKMSSVIFQLRVRLKTDHGNALEVIMLSHWHRCPVMIRRVPLSCPQEPIYYNNELEVAANTV